MLKSLKQSLKITNQKEENYNSSLIIVDQLIIIITALNQGSSIGCFKPIAAIHVEPRKHIKFILFTIHKLFFF